MIHNFKNNFNTICKQDIQTIYKEIEDLLPELKFWQLDQSIILAENKKIVCKAVTSEQGEKIGHQIDIYINDDNMYDYTLTSLENSLELRKILYDKNNKKEEKLKVVLENNYIKKYYCYNEDNILLNYQEIYNLHEHTNIITNTQYYYKNIPNSLEEIIKDQKYILPKYKTRTRKK